jgi:hypothetical protein
MKYETKGDCDCHGCGRERSHCVVEPFCVHLIVTVNLIIERIVATLGEILGFLPDINHHQNDQWYIVNVNSGVTEQSGTCRPRFFNTMKARSQVGRRVASSRDPTL